MATVDEDWLVSDTRLVNNENRDVLINNAYLIVDIGNKSDDIFSVLKEGVSQLKVNNEGVLIIKKHTSLPNVVNNSVIYDNNDFYFSI